MYSAPAGATHCTERMINTMPMPKYAEFCLVNALTHAQLQDESNQAALRIAQLERERAEYFRDAERLAREVLKHPAPRVVRDLAYQYVGDDSRGEDQTLQRVPGNE